MLSQATCKACAERLVEDGGIFCCSGCGLMADRIVFVPSIEDYKKQPHYSSFVYLRSLRFKKLLNKEKLKPLQYRLLLLNFDRVEAAWEKYKGKWSSRKYFVNLRFLLQLMKRHLFGITFEHPKLKDMLRASFQTHIFNFLVSNTTQPISPYILPKYA